MHPVGFAHAQVHWQAVVVVGGCVCAAAALVMVVVLAPLNGERSRVRSGAMRALQVLQHPLLNEGLHRERGGCSAQGCSWGA